MKYSIIVPVYNRPDEVDELLASLCEQEVKDFEVIIVEDGSSVPCDEVCRKYSERLDLKYFLKRNSGPGQSRNYGAKRASGEWLIVLDSDVVLPKGYLTAVDKETHPQPLPIREGSNIPQQKENQEERVSTPLPHREGQGGESAGDGLFSAFGGPDASHPSFTPVQKAISYSMTSFFTTGGIRGGKAKLDKFYPRSYNMGIRRDVYQELDGFSKMRFGEDIDFSYRIVEAGYKTALLPDAWVWHKRRTDFKKFFRQVFNSGIARINLEKRHPGTMNSSTCSRWCLQSVCWCYRSSHSSRSSLPSSDFSLLSGPAVTWDLSSPMQDWSWLLSPCRQSCSTPSSSASTPPARITVSA